jgi:type VI secretion system protein ImpF
MSRRLNPTLLDKLMAGAPGGAFAEASVFADLDSFTETALQANVRRELAWLLNTTNLESALDLARCPEVRTSVLNYGVADLAGKAQSRVAVAARASRIREAVQAFEPRLSTARLAVEVSAMSERENAITFTITDDITSAVQAMHVQYVTDIEVDTGAVEVRE